MLEEAIYKFKAQAPLLMPLLFDNFHLTSVEPSNGYAVLTYEIHHPLPIKQVIDMMNDEAGMILLYHIVPDKNVVDTLFGQEACTYLPPCDERMVKVNFKTWSSGLVHELLVTVYESLDIMIPDVMKDWRMHEGRGHVVEKREHAQIMNDFNCQP